MKTRISLWFAVSLVLASLAVGLGQAQGPQSQMALGTPFTYQGQLRQNGSLINGTCDFQFSLWSAATGGSQTGTTLTKTGVAVSRGLFTVPLDFGAAPFQGEDRYLQIAVRCPSGSGGYTTLTGRQALTATPYALYAASAPWAGLLGVPLGFADNVDDDTTYTAGAGLTLIGNQFSVVFAGTGSASTVARSDHDHDSRYWKLAGNTGTSQAANYVGTTDNVPLNFRVNGTRALRLEPNSTGPNVIGGFVGNNVTAGAGASTIAGGGSGGEVNRVTDSYGTVGGGADNQAGNGNVNLGDANYATVAGGIGNTAGGGYSTVSGGSANAATSNYAVVGGGFTNTAIADYATVAGGLSNTANGPSSTVSGGNNSAAGGEFATVAGGLSNTASGARAAIGGGSTNTASGFAATVGGGANNTASDQYATVGGGEGNTASEEGATVGGGVGNFAIGESATVAGGHDNSATGNYATVAGGTGNEAIGTFSAIGGGRQNQATGERSTVAGGNGNTASAYSATVGGGQGNNASATRATIAGGQDNLASGPYSAIPGGMLNTAQGSYSFAAGRRAKANNNGCFVWGDSTDADVVCSNNDRFVVRASGGVYLYSNSSLTTGVYLAAGASSWTPISGYPSDRNLKENFTPVDGRDVLRQLANIPISAWNYKADGESIRHMGPVAQDFHAAFGLGERDTSIDTVDADGVALAALQGAYQLLQEKDAQIAAQQEQIDDLESRVAALEALVAQLARK